MLLNTISKQKENVTLSIMPLCPYAKCHYAEYVYDAECRYAVCCGTDQMPVSPMVFDQKTCNQSKRQCSKTFFFVTYDPDK